MIFFFDISVVSSVVDSTSRRIKEFLWHSYWNLIFSSFSYAARCFEGSAKRRKIFKWSRVKSGNKIPWHLINFYLRLRCEFAWIKAKKKSIFMIFHFLFALDFVKFPFASGLIMNIKCSHYMYQHDHHQYDRGTTLEREIMEKH